jgi:hypothetical protein
MGFETPEPIVYPRLPPPAVEDPWAWYHNTEMKMTMTTRSKKNPSEDFVFPSSLFGA